MALARWLPCPGPEANCALPGLSGESDPSCGPSVCVNIKLHRKDAGGGGACIEGEGTDSARWFSEATRTVPEAPGPCHRPDSSGPTPEGWSLSLGTHSPKLHST